MSSSTHSLQLYFLRSVMGIAFLEARKGTELKPLQDLLINVNGIKQVSCLFQMLLFFSQPTQ